jgi:hypothetical protein
MATMTFEKELNAQKTMYDALRDFAPEDRARLIQAVNERFARERPPIGGAEFIRRVGAVSDPTG